jgi:hypothetical protein
MGRAPQKDTDTILEKFEKGEQKLLGCWRRGGSSAKEGRPAPSPAPSAPPALGPAELLDVMSLRVKPGLMRPRLKVGGMRGGVGRGGRGAGFWTVSEAMEARWRAAAVSSTAVDTVWALEAYCGE